MANSGKMVDPSNIAVFTRREAHKPGFLVLKAFGKIAAVYEDLGDAGETAIVFGQDPQELLGLIYKFLNRHKGFASLTVKICTQDMIGNIS